MKDEACYFAGAGASTHTAVFNRTGSCSERPGAARTPGR